MAVQKSKRSFYRSRDIYLGGVCSGIADYFELDALVVRILAVLLTLLSFGLAVVVYFVLWAHVPLKPERVRLVDAEIARVESAQYGNLDLYANSDIADGEEWINYPIRGLSLAGRLSMMAVLVLLFVLLACTFQTMAPSVQWWQFWPILFTLIGLFFIVVPVRSPHELAWIGFGFMLTVASTSLLPMTFGAIAWDSLLFTLESLWPITLVALVLYVYGVVRDLRAFVIAGTFCFVLFCLAGAFLCVIPGDIEALVPSFFTDVLAIPVINR